MTDEKPMTVDALIENTRLAWYLGQRYWQQADSESYADNKRSALTLEKFNKLLESGRAAIEQYGREQINTERERINALFASIRAHWIKANGVDSTSVSALDRIAEVVEDGSYVEQRGSGEPTNRSPNPDHVICPKCTHQFRAIPENVQAELAEQRGSGEPVASVDYEAAIEYGSRMFKYKQGTGACIAFSRGAKWQANQNAAPQPRAPLTDEQIDRHTLLAQECPPGSKVILVSSLRRLRAHGIRSEG